MNADPKLEDLMSQLGNFGKYQIIQFSLHCLTCLLAGLHMLAFTFVAKTPKLFRCFIEELDGNLNTTNPTFNQTILNHYIPMKDVDHFDSCKKFSIPGNLNSSLSSCNGQFIYDKSIFHQSRVYEWDLVCEDKWRRALAQSIYVLGVGIGALICGSLSDRFGRKKVLCIAALFQFTFAFITAFIPNYVALCVMLFIYGGVGSAGPVVPGFILTMELLERRKRLYCGIIFGSFFSIGVCFVTFWAYLIRNITILQVVFSLHALLLFGHWFFMDESIRWLWGQGRISEAIKIAKKGAKINKLEFIDKDMYNNNENELEIRQNGEEQLEKKNDTNPLEIKSHGILDLFRTPVIRCRALIISLSFFSTSLSYYGLAFNTGSLPGDPFLIFFLVAAMDLIGDVFILCMVNRVGRRTLNFSYLYIAGISYFVIAFIPPGITTIVISLIGKIACASCFRVVFNYTGEMFPTVVRNSSTGYGTLAARLAGVLAPQVLLLTTVDTRLPPVIIGSVALIAGFSSLFLPETLKKDLPQTIQDGEKFGQGDNAFKSFYTFFKNK